MSHKLNNSNIFSFLKSKSIIEEISNSVIEIIEHRNIAPCLTKTIIENLDSNAKYWMLNPEIQWPFEPCGKRTERVILMMRDGILHIVLLEMKSGTALSSAIVAKFENSLTWTYILLNLLDGKQNQEIKVYGILVAQTAKNWNSKESLNILSSTSIRYIKRSFHATSTEITIKLEDILKEP